MAIEVFDRRVLLVSGKGGTGKTVVAAALATIAARTGTRVLLVDVEGRHGMARLLGIDPPGFEERPGPLGFPVLEITPREALIEYLGKIMGMAPLSGTLKRAKVTEVATEAVPGFRDAMIAGKLYELTQYRDQNPGAGRRGYDLVVVDAPPTGQLVPLLRSAGEYRGMIRMGRASRQLESIDRLLRRNTRVVLVSLLEEMSVAETVEAVGALADLDVPHLPVVANRVLPPVFGKGVRTAGLRMDAAGLRGAAGRGGLTLSAKEATVLLDAALAEDVRVQAQRRHLAAIDEVADVVELPELASPTFGPPEVERLADLFERGER
jgi:anion-transporting  ArsA/GET3 family ATPase